AFRPAVSEKIATRDVRPNDYSPASSRLMQPCPQEGPKTSSKSGFRGKLDALQML
ncbi:unnamed protein product, partial [Amoebophrya sp. A25]